MSCSGLSRIRIRIRIRTESERVRLYITNNYYLISLNELHCHWMLEEDLHPLVVKFFFLYVKDYLFLLMNYK